MKLDISIVMVRKNIKDDSTILYDFHNIYCLLYMGTSMSDPNSIWKNRLVPKSKVLNSGSKQHKSLKKIYLKNITDNQRYSSQIKIG